MNLILTNRRLQFFFIFGLAGTLTGLVMRWAAGVWPEIPPVGNSFFITWWIGAAVGGLLRR